jgi:putative drug exporter of the RND superfamily
VIMVAVFGLFATLSIMQMQQMGFGLAVAVLIDATVIRAVLVPAVMQLLGERNWWLPRVLQRPVTRTSPAARAPAAQP